MPLPVFASAAAATGLTLSPEPAMHILMLAAENGALPGGKVGGIGDVIRDLPRALVARGHRVSVVTPGYGHFSCLPGAQAIAKTALAFGGERHTVTWYRVPSQLPALEYFAVEHPRFNVDGVGKIYHHDSPERPFATDATRFALLCSAVARGLVEQALPRPDVLHLHDWHAALLALLQQHDGSCRSIRDIPSVYSIHNLSLQGIRPLTGDVSSLAAWFPGSSFPLADMVDPRYSDCINPTRAAIRLCGKIHAVSPTYAQEILSPTDTERGFVGGEGLEADLRDAADQGRLVGILNGVDYPDTAHPRLSRQVLFEHALETVVAWRSTEDLRMHHVAIERLEQWLAAPADDAPVLTSVGRLTVQKLGLLLQGLEGHTVLEDLLSRLDDGRLMILGNGDAALEGRLTEIAARVPNLVFLRGFAERLGNDLYSSGDLFLMPSSFEPCGISQMLAMRAGQPCLAHSVGGLRDTIQQGVSGFLFSGATPAEQAANLLTCVDAALAMWRKQPQAWQALREQAAAQRFTWDAAAQRMEEELYVWGGG